MQTLEPAEVQELGDVARDALLALDGVLGQDWTPTRRSPEIAMSPRDHGISMAGAIERSVDDDVAGVKATPA